MSKQQTALARILAQHMGVTGSCGGWLHMDQRPVCQGWTAFWHLALGRGWIVPHSSGTRINSRVHCDSFRINWRNVPSSF